MNDDGYDDDDVPPPSMVLCCHVPYMWTVVLHVTFIGFIGETRYTSTSCLSRFCQSTSDS